MPFGLKKKDKGDGEEESARSSLFSRKSKSTPPAQNPYAAPSNDPYANPPPAYSGPGNDRFRQEKSPAVTSQGGGYGAAPRGGPGPSRQQGYSASGSSQGYGGDRYGDQGQSRRPGGYGGLGAQEPDLDAGRNELFGDAARRAQQQSSAPGAGGPGGPSGPGGPGGVSGAYGQSGAYGSEMPGGYGSYGDRELTAEEQEEEDVNATKQEIRFIKQQDVSSTRNALRLAQQAEETGRDTLQRLGAQGERIHNTERNLDLAANQNRIAEEKARELKTLNKSMFAMHVSNPFTASSRREERDRKIMETHQNERAARDATRQAAWESSARAQAAQQKVQATGGGSGQKSTLADRAKYQFEADSEDDEMENEIDSNLDALHGAAKRLNQLGRAMGEEVDVQNKHIDRIIGKTDRVDDQIAMNRARLDRIR